MTDESVTNDKIATEVKTVQDTDIWEAVKAYNQFVEEMDQFMVLMRTAIGISTAKLHRTLSVLNDKVPMPGANEETLKRVFEEMVDVEMETDEIVEVADD